MTLLLTPRITLFHPKFVFFGPFKLTPIREIITTACNNVQIRHNKTIGFISRVLVPTIAAPERQTFAPNAIHFVPLLICQDNIMAIFHHWSFRMSFDLLKGLSWATVKPYFPSVIIFWAFICKIISQIRVGKFTPNFLREFKIKKIFRGQCASLNRCCACNYKDRQNAS